VYLENKVDFEKVQDIWNREKKIIRFVTGDYSFNTYDEYLNQIEKLQKDKSDLIYEKAPCKGKREYDSNCAEAYGITIEEEDDFHQVYSKRRTKNQTR